MSKTSYRKKKKNDILVDSNDYKNDSEIPLSPAERFNLFKQTIEHSRTMAAKFEQSLSFDSVSYTHLTLPTKRIV